MSKNAEEKKLGNWIGTQKMNYNKQKQAMKDPEKRKLWEEFCEKYKKYLMDSDEKWQQTYECFCEWIDTNKKRPSCMSKNAEEKKLGTWIRNQKNNYNKQKEAMKDPEKRKLWEEFCEKYKDILNFKYTQTETSSQPLTETSSQPPTKPTKAKTTKPTKSILNPQEKTIIKEKLDDHNKRQKQLCKFSELNKKYTVMNSKNLHEQLQKDPTEWHEYHKLMG
jgi:Fe-S cluster biosynthesis and repair protein YggX